MVDFTLNLALTILGVSLFIAFIRFVKGPSLPDRLLAVDTVTLTLAGIFAVLAIKSSFEFFIAVLILAVVGIISSVTVANSLVKGKLL